MALIKCPECGKEISDKAEACPNCGTPLNNKKFCKFCGNQIDKDCVVCPRCGKQVEKLAGDNDIPIVINNSSSASSSASAFASITEARNKPLPWYLTWLWIFIIGCFTGGIYWIVGFILRSNWKANN